MMENLKNNFKLIKTGYQATILGLITILLRLPFTSKILYHWDSVNFAYALTEFNLAKEQPHPPGYILYVYLARIVNSVIQDPNTSMIVISILASGLAVGFIFVLAKQMFEFPVSLISALFLITSPLFWFYGEIALPHSLDAFLVILCSYFLFLSVSDSKYGTLAVGFLAITGGFRPQTLVFLLPLAAYSLVRWKIQKIGKWFLIGFLICLAWFIPLVSLNGGLQNYLNILNQFSDRFQSTTSVIEGAGWQGFMRNGIKFSIYTLYALGLSGLGLFGALLTILRKKKNIDQKSLFLLIWILPAVFYYLFIHMGQQGLIFVFLPALIIISAVGIRDLFENYSKVFIPAIILISLFNASVFLVFPEYPLGGTGTQRILTYQTIRNNDKYYLDRINTVQALDDKESSVIIAQNWRHVQYYLPDFKIMGLESDQKWEIATGDLRFKQGDGFLSLTEASELSAQRGGLELILFDVQGESILKIDLNVVNFSGKKEEIVEIINFTVPILLQHKGNSIYVQMAQ